MIVDSNKILPVKITDKALAEIKDIMKIKGIPSHYGLRIGVKGTGCAGVSHLIGFDAKSVSDNEFLVDGISVYIEKKHFMYIIGMQVDFKDQGEERGFIFISQNIEK